MKAHFVITTSANAKMEYQAEVLMRSIKSVGRCQDSVFTVMTHESKKISNAYLKNHEVIGYEQNANLKYPWSVCARWDVTPAADLVIGLDADVVVLRDLNPLLEQLQDKRGISGTIACDDNFSIKNWKELFDLASIVYPEKTYLIANDLVRPYYVNNGVVSISYEYVLDIRRATKTMIDLINTRHYDDFFITQRATTLAAYSCNVPLNVMPKEFNHLEFCYGQPNKDTYFFHYNVSRDKDFFSPAKFLSKML